jgi:hypothetical protein
LALRCHSLSFMTISVPYGSNLHLQAWPEVVTLPIA